MTDAATPQTPFPAAQSSIPPVSAKDTKADILAAYQELLLRFEEGAPKVQNREQEARRAKEEAAIKHASGFTVEKIVQGCRNLEAAIRTSLSEMSENLIRESKKLAEVQEAIALEEKHLQEVHDIKVAASSLAALIETHRVKEKELEEVMRRRREEWQREEEKHVYDVSQKHKHDEDAYQEKKAALERELAERKQAILADEQEMKALRKRAETFDAEISTAKTQSAKETEERVRREEKTRADFLAQETKREKEIAQLKTASLAERVEQLTAEVAALRTQLKSASQEAKEIALKVIEGSTTLGNLRRMHMTDSARSEG